MYARKVRSTSESLFLSGGGCCFLLLGESCHHLCLFDSLPFFASLLGLLDLGPSGLGLIGQLLCTGLLSLSLVDELHEDTFVLEHITFSLQVQFVVKMTDDLFGLTITFKESSENSHALHPYKLLGHTGIFGTLPLTKASVTAFTSGLGVITNAGARMDSNGLFDDKTILDELADILPRVGVGKRKG